jgi:hypothetical protein
MDYRELGVDEDMQESFHQAVIEQVLFLFDAGLTLSVIVREIHPAFLFCPLHHLSSFLYSEHVVVSVVDLTRVYDSV